MFGIRKLLSRGAAPTHLSEDVRAALAEWQSAVPPDLGDAHFHVRYVVVDIQSSGLHPENDELQGIAATAVNQAGSVLPDDSYYLDLAQCGEGEHALERALCAFLQFVGKSPVVTYHVPYVGAFLQRALKDRLGLDFQPSWVDLAWLMPSMFEEKAHSVLPLDQWLELFGLESGEGRRDAMENTLLLARLFQMLLVRAHGKGVDTAQRLIDESRASAFLRRTH